MSRKWRALIVGCLLSLLGTIAPSSQPARADRELSRAGKYGDHGLIDAQSAPGAICRFAPPLVWSIGETWLQVRPPMMFAHDSTPGDDQQLVGWRAIVMRRDRAREEWTPFAVGATQRAIATEIFLASFASRGPETQFHLGYGAYRVRLELFWYERLGDDGEPRVVGQATYEIEHYAIEIRHRSGMRQVGVSGECGLNP